MLQVGRRRTANVWIWPNAYRSSETLLDLLRAGIMRGGHNLRLEHFQGLIPKGGGLLTFCKWAIRIAAVLYLVALALLVVGTFGLFGQEQDPLAGVFLMPLGLPWVIWLDDLPDEVLPWIAVLAPLFNLVLLNTLCRNFAGRGSP